MDCRSWFFDLRYLLGRPPWDTEVTPPEVVTLIEGEGLVPGRALDLGCGTGTNCIYLARHNWEVVGVDFSILAIRRARRKARQTGVDCQFYRGDVTDLAFLADPFDLALDIGCLHSLSPERWERYATEVARLVRPGGLYLLYAFTPRPDQSPDPPDEDDLISCRSLSTGSLQLSRMEQYHHGPDCQCVNASMIY